MREMRGYVALGSNLGDREGALRAGLQGMRRRLEEIGGALEMKTGPGDGFQLRATLPAGTA